MLTPEEEAKGLWCFSGRVYGGQNRNQAGGPHSKSLCLGSGCAAWRWQGWKIKGHLLIAQDPPEEDRDGPRLGYCGLAGEPSPYGPR